MTWKARRNIRGNMKVVKEKEDTKKLLQPNKHSPTTCP
jgi:hypothetical protein